ncbi:MAG: PRC-barrel domain-containing protein [Filomicrobium sp.]
MFRSSTELIRYDVEAADGRFGAVRDFYFDDRTWTIRYIAVETNGLLSSDRVLITPQSVRELKFPDESFVLGLKRSEVETTCGTEMLSQSWGQNGTAGTDTPAKVSEPLLHSIATISHFSISGSDAPLGYLNGLLIETTTWSIRYLIVDTGRLLPGKLVLLSPRSITSIDWEQKIVRFDLTSDAVKNSPRYDVDAQLNREYEAFLHDYYGWPPYWL